MSQTDIPSYNQIGNPGNMEVMIYLSQWSLRSLSNLVIFIPIYLIVCLFTFFNLIYFSDHARLIENLPCYSWPITQNTNAYVILILLFHLFQRLFSQFMYVQ